MNFSLRAKTASIIVVILFLAIAANTLVDSHVFIEEYSDALKSRAVVVGKGLRSELDRLLALGIPLDELTGFDEQCREAVATYGLSYAMVVERNGHILFHNDPSQQGKKITSDLLKRTFENAKETVYPYSDGETEYYNVVLPVFVPEMGHVAAVEVGFPTDVITQKSRPLIRHATEVAVASFLLAVFVVFFMFSRWVTHPLGRLLSVIQEIRCDGSGLDKQVEIHSRDEIGKLGKAFNEMIADLRRSQKKVQEYAKNMEQMVEERTRELEKTREELIHKAVDAGRAQISSMVLHNIGNAVTPVKIHMEAMKRDNLPQLSHYIERSFLDLSGHAGEIQRYIHEDPQGKEVFSFMGRAIEAMKAGARARDEVINRLNETLAYISDILTLQQKYVAKEMGAKELVDLNSVIEDAVHMQASALEKRGITIRKDLTRSLSKIVIDKSRLMQVLVNLIKNAYEAVDEVAKEGREKAITLRSYQEGEYVCLEVEDNGIGIEPEQMPTLYEFGQSHKGSSGVGLYYCKMFLEANGGTLNISSEGREKGATVLMSLRTGQATYEEKIGGKE